MRKQVLIQVDDREREAQAIQYLQDNSGVELRIERLTIGDYVIDRRVTVERKTTCDFVVSIVDGRLFRQAARLKKEAVRPILLIEGRNLYDVGIDIDPAAVRGALVSVVADWYLPVLFSADSEETAALLLAIASGCAKDAYGTWLRAGYKPKSVNKRKSFILQGLPQVGPEIAKRLLEQFGSVEKVVAASEEDLTKVPGIGKGRARKIRDILKEERAAYRVEPAGSH